MRNRAADWERDNKASAAMNAVGGSIVKACEATPACPGWSVDLEHRALTAQQLELRIGRSTTAIVGMVFSVMMSHDCISVLDNAWHRDCAEAYNVFGWWMDSFFSALFAELWR